jgi:hypothetical protein
MICEGRNRIEKVHNEELHSQILVGWLNVRGHVARVGTDRNAYKILVGEL